MNDAPSARQFRESFGEGLLSLGTSDWNGSVCDGRTKVADRKPSATAYGWAMKKIRDIAFYLPSSSKYIGKLKWGSYAVALHFLKSLPNAATADTSKIVVQPIEDGTPSVTELLNVLHINEPFDFSLLETNDSVAIKQAFLELLRRAIARGVHEKKWDQRPFDAAYRAVVDDGYLLESATGTKITSPDRKRRAQVWYRVDTFATTLGVEFFDARGRKKGRLVLGEIEPTWIALHNALGNFRWIDDKTVELHAARGERRWRIGAPSDSE